MNYAEEWKQIGDRFDWSFADEQARESYEAPVDWQQNPEGMAVQAWFQYLRCRVWAQGRTTPLAAYCLHMAHKHAQEAVAVDAFEHDPVQGAFPLNRFDLLTAKVWIDAFFKGEGLDRREVLRIADDAVAVSATYEPYEWGALPQSKYLSTVELLLLVDERDRAASLVKTARTMRGRHVKEPFDVVKLILKRQSFVRDDEVAKSKYRTTFDILRSPRYSSGGGRFALFDQLLVMACMWQKFFEPGNGTFDPDKAIDLIWE